MDNFVLLQTFSHHLEREFLGLEWCLDLQSGSSAVRHELIEASPDDIIRLVIDELKDFRDSEGVNRPLDLKQVCFVLLFCCSLELS